MIINIEELRKMRLAVGTVWTRMDSDNAHADIIAATNKLLLTIILELEDGGKCIIEKGGTDV
jgi:hypothetical protein